MKTILFLATLCVATFFTSCKKEETSTPLPFTYEEPFPNEITGTLGQEIYCKRSSGTLIKSYFNIFVEGKTGQGKKLSILCKRDTLIAGKTYVVLPDTGTYSKVVWALDTINVSNSTQSLFREGWVFN